jgi:hypothetical protein
MTFKLVNPRELIRKVLKISFLFLINYLLLNTLDISPSNKIKIITVNIIMFSIIDILFPSININDKNN